MPSHRDTFSGFASPPASGGHRALCMFVCVLGLAARTQSRGTQTATWSGTSVFLLCVLRTNYSSVYRFSIVRTPTVSCRTAAGHLLVLPPLPRPPTGASLQTPGWEGGPVLVGSDAMHTQREERDGKERE